MSKKITALYEHSATRDDENIRRQRSNLETYARGMNFSNLQHFTDNGYSAYDEMRPGFLALLKEIEADNVDVLIMRDVSRPTRNAVEFSKLVDDLQAHGVRIIALNEQLDLLPPHIHDDDNGLDYTLNGDYYLPFTELLANAEKRQIGKWGVIRRIYLESNRPGLYTEMIITGKLDDHLAEIDRTAKKRRKLLIDRMKKGEGMAEELKATDPMAWVQRMNAIVHTADELVLSELIYA